MTERAIACVELEGCPERLLVQYGDLGLKVEMEPKSFGVHEKEGSKSHWVCLS